MGELSLGSRIFELGKWTVANDIKDRWTQTEGEDFKFATKKREEQIEKRKEAERMKRMYTIIIWINVNGSYGNRRSRRNVYWKRER